jgi:hypothetical protein
MEDRTPVLYAQKLRFKIKGLTVTFLNKINELNNFMSVFVETIKFNKYCCLINSILLRQEVFLLMLKNLKTICVRFRQMSYWNEASSSADSASLRSKRPAFTSRSTSSREI